MANAGRKIVSGVNTLVTIKSVTSSIANSKAYKKVIADSKGVLNGSPDIYQDYHHKIDEYQTRSKAWIR